MTPPPLLDPMGRPVEPSHSAGPAGGEVTAEEYRDRLLRLQAEFDNVRKRLVKEQLEFERRANERLLTEFLGLADDFERALAATEGAGVVQLPLAAATEADLAHFKAGLEMIYRRMGDLLKAYGVEAIATIGQPFDPARHEAVAHVATTDYPEATIVEELRKGYTLHGRVIRPATVKVAITPVTEKEDLSDGTRNRD